MGILVWIRIPHTTCNPSTDEERTGQGPPESEAREKLRTSDAVLAIFEKHLGSEWDIDDDGSSDRPELQPDGSASSSRKRLKRKAGDRSDSEDSEDVRRRLRVGIPPSTEESSSGEDSSRTCCSEYSDGEWDR